MKKTFALSIVAATLIGSNGLALAGDVAAGKAKASACAGCHGANGIASNPMYPNLAGQNEKYFVKALKEYKDGTRKDATMSAFVGGLSDADMENLAAYYKSLK